MADDGGIGRFKRRFAAMRRDIEEATGPALMKSGQELATSMRTLAPRDDGDLIDSITITGPGKSTPPYSQPGGQTTVPENAVAVTVGDHVVRYAHLVEYGTALAPAQPFFWPSVRLQQKRATNRIKRAVRKAVRDNWGSGS